MTPKRLFLPRFSFYSTLTLLATLVSTAAHLAQGGRGVREKEVEASFSNHISVIMPYITAAVHALPGPRHKQRHISAAGIQRSMLGCERILLT